VGNATAVGHISAAPPDRLRHIHHSAHANPIAFTDRHVGADADAILPHTGALAIAKDSVAGDAFRPAADADICLAAAESDAATAAHRHAHPAAAPDRHADRDPLAAGGRATCRSATTGDRAHTHRATATAHRHTDAGADTHAASTDGHADPRTDAHAGAVRFDNARPNRRILRGNATRE
jgi:hypothetical protein